MRSFPFSVRLKSTVVLAALFLFSFAGALASDVNGRIKGTVTDPTGAVLPNVDVVATNQATGVKYVTKSQSGGGYSFQQLPVGTYSISATVAGFKSFTASGILLTIDQEYVEAIQLTTGSANDTVTVEADTVQVNTTDMQLNNIVGATQIEELPLIGRNFTGLELTLPGVQASSDRFGTFSVSGAQTQQSEFLVNGADTNDIALNTLAIVPNLDAIGEFNLIEGPLNAEYDRNSGGIVSATIKQGTNHFHGNVFEFYRDTFLNTPGYFAYNSATNTKTNSTYHQNIYGGTVGGPIVKNKLFFFGAYQGTHQTVPGGDGTGANNLLSVANRTGNFSEDVGTGPRPVSSATQCSGNPGAPDWGNFSGCTTVPGSVTIANCTAGEFWSQCAYDNNGVFAPANLNPIAAKLVSSYLPTPNNGTYGYNFNSTVKTTDGQEIGRIDYSLNAHNQFTFLGIYDKSTVASTIPFTGASVPGFGENDILHAQQYTFDYVRQLGSSAVNDFALHWTRFNYAAVTPQTVVNPSSLGFSIVPQDTAAASVPTISVGGNFTNFTLGFSTNGPQPRIDQVYQVDETISKSIGHHQLKAGYDGRRFNVSNPFHASNSGNFGFSSSQGSAGANSIYSTGDGGLDFLLGIPGTYAQGSGASIQADAFLNYVYAQDAWKLTNSFTVNYGLGYSIDTPLRNHQYGGEAVTCLIPGQQSKIFAAAPIGLSYPGDPGCTISGRARTHYNEFGPRIGFAWAPDLGMISGSPGKFSIRGGFGLYYNRSEEETALQTLQTPPFGTSTSGAADFGGVPSFANPFADVNDPTQSEPNKFPYTYPTKGQVISPSSYNPVYYASTFDPSFRASYAENFQVSVERELPSQVITRFSYVGSLGRHNQITTAGNPETAAGHAACLAGNENSPVAGGTLNCIANRNIQDLYFPQNTAYGQIYAATGYPGFTNIGEVGSEASSSYHSFQASVTKAPTHGLTFQLSYTYSHALDNGSSFENAGFGEAGARGYNQYVPSLNYGDSNFDVRHRVVFSPIYVAPHLAGEWYSPKNIALSGWEVSGIVTLATGFPYDISYAGSTTRSLYCDFTGYYACPDVPLQVSGLQRLNPRSASAKGGWFDPGSFAPEPIGSFGNIHRDPYHGPGINNTNMILAKNFPLGSDSVRRLQLRMESDNVFNHTQFSNPTSTYGSGLFGVITGTQNAARQTQLAAKFYF